MGAAAVRAAVHADARRLHEAVVDEDPREVLHVADLVARVVELDPARARLSAIREPMALDLNAGRVFLSHSVQGRPVFGLKPDAAVVGPVQASTVGPLQVTTPTREKSLTGSMYGSSEPHAMTEPLIDYLAGARLQPPRSLTGARFPLDLINDAVGSAVTGGRGRVLVMTGC